MISVEEALDALFDLTSPLSTEIVPLRRAAGRVLARAATARRSQPPFRSSSMDGYAIPAAKIAPGDRFRVVGEAAAGHAFPGAVGPGEAVRIFTGAPVPDGAVRVVIQEDVTRDGDSITIGNDPDSEHYIRPLGVDFEAGQTLEAPRRLSASDIALLASMNVPEVAVYRRPIVALIATGDELVQPGETPTDAQIIASNGLGLAALIEARGGIARILPIARDRLESLEATLVLAAGSDLVVTLGGASVGDHDLVAKALEKSGVNRAFYKVAMRPGKPLMAGSLNGAVMLGLPGNPVSSMVCGHVFMLPILDAMQGLPAAPRPRERHALTAPLAANGPREHYMRAQLGTDGVRAASRQDSSLLSVLADADALIVRPPFAPAADKGTPVDVIRL